MTKAVAKATATDLVASEDTAMFDGIAGGTGFENVTAKDLLIPRLGILQGLSPQVTQGKPEYDTDAKVGMVYDLGLQEGFSDGVVIIPVHYAKAYLEWAPRKSGKGLIKIHDDESILDQTEKDDKNKNVLPNGNYIVETAQFYVLNVTANCRKSFIPMTSTQLKKARRILTLAQSEKLPRADGSEFTPPLFFRTYVLTTVPESNAEGDWMGWKVERGVSLPELPNWKGIMAEIESFREALKRGEAKGDLSGLDGAEGRTPDDGTAGEHAAM